jgi:hypothetical protein
VVVVVVLLLLMFTVTDPGSAPGAGCTTLSSGGASTIGAGVGAATAGTEEAGATGEASRPRLDAPVTSFLALAACIGLATSGLLPPARTRGRCSAGTRGGGLRFRQQHHHTSSGVATARNTAPARMPMKTSHLRPGIGLSLCRKPPPLPPSPPPAVPFRLVAPPPTTPPVPTELRGREVALPEGVTVEEGVGMYMPDSGSHTGR